jgi:uncharacterized protein (TIGR00251 family)
MKNEGENSGFRVSENAEGITFSVHVQPRASRNEIAGLSGSELKVRLTSPPVEGAANTLCREFLARLLHVAKSDVRIIAGEKSRHKVVTIHGASRESALALLNKQSRSSE